MVELSASATVILLALVPAVLWGFSPVFSKRGMAAGGTTLQAAVVVVVVDTSLYLGVLAYREGLGDFLTLTPDIVLVFAAAGFAGTALARLSVFAGIRRLGASVNTAAISARPVFATVFAAGFLGERPSLVTVGGILVLVVGLLVLSVARGGDIRGWERRHLAYPLAAAALFAVGNVVRRFGLQETAATTLQAVTINEMAAFAGLATYAVATGRLSDLRAPRRSYVYFAGSGLITGIALLALFTAFDQPSGLVAVVDPLVATSPLFTAVFAYFLLGDLERVTRRVVGGALLIVAGAAFVTLG